MSVNLSFIGGAGWQFFDDNGDPLSGGKVFTYAAGTTTPLATYTNRDGITPNSNPIILDAAGRTPQQIWATEGVLYKYVVKTSTDITLRTWDNIGGSVVASDLAQDLANTTNNAKGDALIGFKQSNAAGFLASATARTVSTKFQESVSVKDFGAAGDGATDDSAAFAAALQSGARDVYVPAGDYAFTSAISVTLPTTVRLHGVATLVYTGAASNASPLMTVETDANSFYLDGLTFDGNNNIAAGIYIKNTTVTPAISLPNCVVSNNTFFDFRKTVAGLLNDAVFLAGSFQVVTVNNNRVRNITRAAGTGVPAVTGTSGITVTTASTTKYVRECVHFGNSYVNILGDDLLSSAANVDYDGFRFFGPDPSTDGNQYVPATLNSYANTYQNCRGRALKIQAIGTVSNETIIRDADYTLYGGSVEINFQFGVGSVSNCQFIYRSYGGVSPIQSDLTLVSFYQGSDYGEETGGVFVNGLQVFNSIPVGLGTNIGCAVEATVGTLTVGVPYRPLVSVSNISINANTINEISRINYSTNTYGILRLDNVVVPKLNYCAVAAAGTETNFDIVATNVVNIDGVVTAANAKPFVQSISHAPLNFTGMISGGLNQGFLNPYARIGTDRAPMLTSGALADPNNSLGGSVSVQSAALADDATTSFEPRFYQDTIGLFAVSVNFTFDTQGLFATSNNQIYSIAATGGSLFAVSTTGLNPDTDGRFNMWYTGGRLYVKNRLGDTRVVTVTFLG